MPGEDINTTLRFDTDISEFSAAMQEAKRAAGLAQSEFKAVSSGMDDWSNSTEGLTAKLKQLSAQQQVEERRLAILQAAYEKTAKEQGENSKQAVELKTKLNNQQAAVNKAASEHEKFAQKLADVKSGASGAATDVKKAGDAAKQAGDDAKEAGDGWTIFKDVIADFVSNAISGLVDSIVNAAEATREYRREMALLAQNAADSGNDVGVMKDVLADVSAVTGEADAAMEGLNMLMASGLDTDGIVLASEALSGAATRFDGVKFEGIAEGLQETLAVGAAVGPFAEVIERTGGNLEEFNAGMEACSTEAERQQYVLDWLANSGLKDVHDAYVQNNSDLVEAEKAQFRHNEAMAKVGAVLEPVQTALTNLGATILEKIAPVIEDTIAWVLENLPTVGPIVTGIAVAFGVLAAALAIQGIINGVTKAFALLNATFLANPIVLIVAAVAGLVTAFVGLWNNCEGFRNFFIDMWEKIKGFFGPIVEWFGNAAAAIGNFFSGAWQGIQNAWSNAKSWASEKWQSISSAFQNVGGWFKEKFSNAWTGIKNAWANTKSWASEKWQSISNAFQNAGGWFKEKFSNAWTNVKNAWSGAKTFFSNTRENVNKAFSSVDTWLTNKFGDSWTGIKNAFANSTVAKYFGQVWNSVKGVFSAVKSVLSGNFSEAWESIKGVFAGWGDFFSGLWNKVKNAFSNAWQNMSEIGKNIVQGIWSGISNAFNWIKEKIMGWVGNVMDFIKGLFGIQSPSKVMRDEVGKMLGLGMAEGIENSLSAVNGAMRGLNDAALSGFHSGAGNGAAVGGRTFNFYQTNNSPKALSRREIYRQTHNALAHAGGV